jgi:hypothetical protein
LWADAKKGFITMNWLTALLSRLATASEWRDISTAPFDRAIELAVIDGEISVLGSSCLRQADGWLNAETLKPVTVTATHWRFRQAPMIPPNCC